MKDNEACQRCICPKCILHKTDECLIGEDYCEECESDYPTEICTSFEIEEE